MSLSPGETVYMNIGSYLNSSFMSNCKHYVQSVLHKDVCCLRAPWKNIMHKVLMLYD